MKKHNIVKVVLVTMLVFMLLTWILPAAYYSSSYVDQGRVQMGLFDLFNYPLTSLSYFGYMALFVLFVGGFYGILYKIPAYRTFLDKIVTKCRGKEKIVLSIIMIVLAVLTSICGMQLALVIFFPFLVSIIFLLGYDKIVAALALVGSTMIGIAGSTYGYGNISVLLSTLSLDITFELLSRVIILLLGLVLLIFNTMIYIKRLDRSKKNEVKAEKKAVKKSSVKKEAVEDSKSKTTKTAKSSKTTKASSKSSRKDTKAALKEEEVIVISEPEKIVNEDEDCYIPTSVSEKGKIWPIVLTFSILFIVMILAFIPWASSFKLNAFEEAKEAVTSFELFGFTLFGKLLGTVNAFGAWSITDMFLVLAVLSLILILIYKVKLDDAFDGIADGVKRALMPAFIVILVYTCLVIVTYHPFQLVIYKAILGVTKGFNVFTSSVAAILASLFNSDPAYSFQSVLPYFTSVITNTKNYPIVGVVFQSIYGLTMLAAPTSLVLMGMLSYLHIPYGKWLKSIWRLLVELLIVLLIVFTVLVLI